MVFILKILVAIQLYHDVQSSVLQIFHQDILWHLLRWRMKQLELALFQGDKSLSSVQLKSFVKWKWHLYFLVDDNSTCLVWVFLTTEKYLCLLTRYFPHKIAITCQKHLLKALQQDVRHIGNSSLFPKTFKSQQSFGPMKSSMNLDFDLCMKLLVGHFWLNPSLYVFIEFLEDLANIAAAILAWWNFWIEMQPP